MVIVASTVICIFCIRVFSDAINSVPLIGMLFIVAVATLIAVVFICILKRFRFFRILSYRDSIICGLLVFLINYNLYGLVPFNVARSNSMIMMGYLLDSTGSYRSKQEITDFAKKTYFVDYDAIGRRLDEQVNAGNIEIKDGQYALTKKGILVTQFFSDIADVYLIKTNLITKRGL